MTTDITILRTGEHERYDGDTADLTVELPVDSLLVSYSEAVDAPTVKIGLGFEDADTLASRLTGEIPDAWKAQSYESLEGDS